MAAAYRWVVTKDRINTGEYAEPKGNWGGNRKGWEGPRNCDPTLKANGVRWSAYDDDGECYYEGMLYGDFDGFEPLDDFAGPDAGCTAIKIDGEWL